jgi:hypothetical protein
MANDEHVALLKQGVAAWNEWRRKSPDIRPDLSEANLSEATLSGANLSGAKLSRTNLSGANLGEANLIRADLDEANLTRANLSGADLSWANLYEATRFRADLSRANLSANLIDANLSEANLSAATLIKAKLGGANLSAAYLPVANLAAAHLGGANLTRSVLGSTFLVDVDLTGVIGLETCEHNGSSIIDHRTLEQSGPLPLSFLRGVGLPDNFIEYLPSLLNQAIQHYSCFISYSTKDQEFAERLHGDLQNKGVRCWFAPHDLRIGAKTWDAIDEAIKLRDKLLLILSKNSIDSDWVEDEVQKAFAEERERKQLVLFPVRIDDAVMETPEPWARKLRDQRNVGDFQHWKDHDAYKRSFERVVRDLTRLAPSGSRPSE